MRTGKEGIGPISECCGAAVQERDWTPPGADTSRTNNFCLACGKQCRTVYGLLPGSITIEGSAGNDGRYSPTKVVAPEPVVPREAQKPRGGRK